MILVNLFGTPGAGKSTGAAYIFSKVKMAGVNAELIGEFAKDKVWEENWKALNNQAYIFGKQYYRISRCADKVDVIITDSPMPLCILYNQKEALIKDGHFENMVINVFNSYETMNYLIKRVKPYNESGRYQDEAGADSLLNPIRDILHDHKICYMEYVGDQESYDWIARDIIDRFAT